MERVSAKNGYNGWNTYKLHMSMSLPDNMQTFGSGRNQSGKPGEEHQKNMFKIHTQRSNRQSGLFTVQVCTRYGEMVLAQLLHNLIQHMCLEKSEQIMDKELRCLMPGMYTLEMKVNSASEYVNVKTLWHDCNRIIQATML